MSRPLPFIEILKTTKLQNLVKEEDADKSNREWERCTE